jgi:hypothetical protein
MAKKNSFYGASLSFSIVSTYFPVNSNYPYFHHFVFQPMMGDGHKTNDDYTLIAYAVDSYGNVLNSYPLQASNAIPVDAKQTVQYANMNLGLDGLGTLYPTGAGVISDISLFPTDFYLGTNYVYYTAETQGPGGFVIYTSQINPSPPY